MLIPLDSGNGRSSMVLYAAERFRESNALKFSSRELCLEFKLTGTERNIDEICLEIRENSEYANQYQGVVAFDMDALLPELEHKDGVCGKFFEMAKRVGRHAMLMLYVPADCPQKKLDRIASEFGAGLQVLDAIVPTTNGTTGERGVSR
jgi:hypothetical protein